MRNLGSDLEQFDFQFLMRQALQRVPTGIDTREGSIIFDALAPALYELAEMYMQLRLMYQAVFIQTTFDNYLELRVAEQGLTRRQATPAVNLAYFENTDGEPFQGDLISTVFATIGAENSIRYTVTGGHEESGIGHFRLTCDEPGTVGNDYQGELIPISHINALGSVTMLSNLVPGQNKETDDSLRERFFEAVNGAAFGGNITQYRREVMSIDGVGAVQIHPVWDGGGTVKVVILGGDYNVVSQNFIDSVQEILDPSNGIGLGIAPIGHRVTVGTPTPRTINVSVSVDLVSGFVIDQVEIPISEILEEYFKSLRQVWDSSDSLNRFSLAVFRSQIMASTLGVTGVANVSQTLLNNDNADIQLTQTGQLQELPILGEVIVNVN